MLEVEGLTVRFGDRAALEGVSFAVQPGEMVLVTGPSGCGKSTLARCLNGLIPHRTSAHMEGRVRVAGLDTRDQPVSALAAVVGVVLQRPEAQLLSLTVEEEVAFGPRNLGLPPEEVTTRVEEALYALGLAHLRDRPPTVLSAGEKQRLAAAAVLAMEPKLLVLDEALSALDVAGTAMLTATLAQLARDRGTAVLLLEHRIGHLARLASRVLVMDRGRIAAQGHPGVVLAQRSLLRRLGLRRPAQVPHLPWHRLIVPSHPRPAAGQPLLELEDVQAGYESCTVIRGVDLSLWPGEMVALVGDNGAGKSTLARVMAGLLPLRGGRMRFGGSPRLPRPGREVALLMESPDEQLFCDSVEEEARFGAENLGIEARGPAEEALRAVGLTALRRHRPHTLSAGQRHRTALAALLALRPKLLILDEPTLGQDWGHLSRFMDYICRLNACGMTVLIVTHDYKLVHRYAQRVVLLDAGRVALDGVVCRRQGAVVPMYSEHGA